MWRKSVMYLELQPDLEIDKYLLIGQRTFTYASIFIIVVKSVCQENSHGCVYSFYTFLLVKVIMYVCCI